MLKIIDKIRKDSFYKDLFVTFVGQIVVMLLSFILNKIISNQYTVSDFGTYNLIKRLASVITFVMLMALGIAIPKFVAEAKAKKDNKLMESYMLSGIITICGMFVIVTMCMTIFGKFWGKVVFNDSSYESYMLVVCLFSLANCLVTYVYSYYRGINSFYKYSFINIVLQVIFIVPTIFVKQDLWLLYLVWAIVTITYALIEMIIIYKKNQYSMRNVKNKLFTFRELITYSLPRMPGEFILFAYSLVPLTIISYKFGKTQVGYFSAALSINSLITPLFSLVGTILLPLVSGSKLNNSENEVNKKIRILGYIYLIVSVLGVAFVFLFGKIILIILFNQEYVKSFNLVKIMIVSIIPNAFYLLLRNPLDGKSKFPYNTICLAISFIVYIILLAIAPSIEMCAVYTIVAYSLLGGLSLICWNRVKSSKS